MKLTIELSTDEAEGFGNWSKVVKPDQLNDAEFIRQIFFNGIELLNKKLQDATRKMISDPEMRQKLESSGINVSALESSLPIKNIE
jgi:hypothetical protein